jgi:hypothetical protein
MHFHNDPQDKILETKHDWTRIYSAGILDFIFFIFLLSYTYVIFLPVVQ